jgi:hypothetical protein
MKVLYQVLMLFSVKFVSEALILKSNVSSTLSSVQGKYIGYEI